MPSEWRRTARVRRGSHLDRLGRPRLPRSIDLKLSTSAWLGALALAAAGSSQDAPKAPATHALRLAAEAGSGWLSKSQRIRDSEGSRKTKVKTTHAGESRDDDRSVEEHVHEEIRSRVKLEILEVEGAEVRGVRTTFEESRSKISVERDGKTVRKGEGFEAAPFEGIEVTLHWGKDENDVSLKGGSLEEAQREELKAGLVFRDLQPLVGYLLPKDPVKVGETWAIEGRALGQLLSQTLGSGEDQERARKSLPPEIKADREIVGTLTAKLAEVGEEGGHTLATVSIAGKPKEERTTEAKDAESTASTAYDIRATLVFVIDLGLPRSLEWNASWKTKLTATGERRDSEKDLEMSFTQSNDEEVTFDSKTDYEPLEGAPSRPAAGEKGEGEEKKSDKATGPAPSGR
ncbi:MAG TPA: hypothetical protein VKF62_08370 [Planctomycetota bacterium]|nr:hypothetical protein [Planctomycetota bacterium]